MHTVHCRHWISDNTEYRSQLPDDVKKILDKHEAADTIDSQEYMDAVMVFYRRHLNRMDPWPNELKRSFGVFSPPGGQFFSGKARLPAEGFRAFLETIV